MTPEQEAALDATAAERHPNLEPLSQADGDPSAADLDAVSAEQDATKATGTPDTVHLDPLRYESLMAAEKCVEALKAAHDTQTAELLKVSGELQKAYDAVQSLQQQLSATPKAANLDSAAAIETKEYSDGTTATGVAPLPDQSPAQQQEQEQTNG